MRPRAVADTNVWVAAAIAPNGVCGQLLDAALHARWEPIASPLLIDELAEVLRRKKFRRWLSIDEAAIFVAGIRAISDLHPDPDPLAAGARTADPDDDYLVALAQSVNDVIALVSGDPHLTELSDLQPPVLTPAAFLALLRAVTTPSGS
jgi:putative PIN family toxin of toxin-antitoxin system